MQLPFPPSWAHFCDEGPRFFIVNMVIAALHLTLCVVLAIVVEYPWNLWFCAAMLFGVPVNATALNATWLKSRTCGTVFALMSWWHFGHAIAGLLLMSSVYRNGYPALKLGGVVAGLFVLMGASMAFVAAWHQNIICPLDVTSPSRPGNQVHPRIFTYWSCAVGFLSCVIYGIAVSRMGSGLVPAEGISESVLGTLTAFNMLGFYSRTVRVSTWGFVSCLFWSLVITANLGFAGAIYPMMVDSYDSRMHYGISFLNSLLYALSFDVIFAIKFWLGEKPEDVETNLSSIREDHLKPDGVPSMLDLEARSFGMRHSGEQPRKSNLKDPRTQDDRDLKHVNTAETDVDDS